MLRRNLVTGAILAAGVALLAAPVAGAAPSPVPTQGVTAAPAAVTAKGDVGVTALYEKHVKSNTSSVRVFTSATGEGTWGSWGPCTNFYTDRTDGSRYHTWVVVGGVTYDAWVTSSSDYIAPGWC